MELQSLTRTEGSTSRWPNPTDSVGRLINQDNNGNSCWEAVGPARELFEKTLSTRVKNFIARSAIPYFDAVTWSICMTGPIPDTAVPRLIFYSVDDEAGRFVLNSIRESGLLKSYPALEIGDSPFNMGDGLI